MSEQEGSVSADLLSRIADDIGRRRVLVMPADDLVVRDPVNVPDDAGIQVW